MTSSGDRACEPRGESSAGAREVPVLEWILGVLGALLVLGSIAYLTYQALVQGASPPDVRLVAEEVVSLPNGYLIRLRAFNQGRTTASQLTLEGELIDRDGVAVETSDITLDYLPGRSEREGGLFFTRDPRDFEVRLRAKGYLKP